MQFLGPQDNFATRKRECSFVKHVLWIVNFIKWEMIIDYLEKTDDAIVNKINKASLLPQSHEQ